MYSKHIFVEILDSTIVSYSKVHFTVQLKERVNDVVKHKKNV